METFDRNSPGDWEKLLAKEGMPEEPPSLEVHQEEQENSKNEEMGMLAIVMHDVLEKYSDLPLEMQQGVIDYVHEQYINGVPFSEVSKKVKVLVEKTGDFMKMKSPEDSDLVYRKKRSIEELKLNGEVEKFLEELKKIKQEREKEEEKKKEEEKEKKDDKGPKFLN